MDLERPWPRAGTSPVAQVSQEPIRVGGNVQESKLIKKVEPIYPELAKRARVEQIVMLETTINEEGLVSNVRVIKGHPLLDQAAVEAVKQWVYQPTYLNGRPMPVIATVTLPFSLSPQVTLAADGYLMDAQGGIVPLESLRDGPVRITPAAGASFELIQRTLSNLNAQGIARITLVSQGYSWIGGRLFYQSPSVTNFDPTTKAPVIEYDTARAVELAKASGRLPVGSSGVIGLAYTVCIDESAKIVAVVGQSGPWSIPEVDEVFRQARVISPGLKDNTPVPMALRITLQVPLN
jgi:protein TonB